MPKRKISHDTRYAPCKHKKIPQLTIVDLPLEIIIYIFHLLNTITECYNFLFLRKDWTANITEGKLLHKWFVYRPLDYGAIAKIWIKNMCPKISPKSPTTLVTAIKTIEKIAVDHGGFLTGRIVSVALRQVLMQKPTEQFTIREYAEITNDRISYASSDAICSYIKMPDIAPIAIVIPSKHYKSVFDALEIPTDEYILRYDSYENALASDKHNRRSVHVVCSAVMDDNFRFYIHSLHTRQPNPSPKELFDIFYMDSDSTNIAGYDGTKFLFNDVVYRHKGYTRFSYIDGMIPVNARGKKPIKDYNMNPYRRTLGLHLKITPDMTHSASNIFNCFTGTYNVVHMLYFYLMDIDNNLNDGLDISRQLDLFNEVTELMGISELVESESINLYWLGNEFITVRFTLSKYWTVISRKLNDLLFK